MPDWLREALLGAIPKNDEARIRQLLMEFLSIGHEPTKVAAQIAADSRDIPLRIVVDPPLGLWSRVVRWWKHDNKLHKSYP